MAGLVDYDSSSSDSDSELWANKRLKSSPVGCSERLDASVLVAERDYKEREHHLNAEPAIQLEEMGCSSDLILHALSVCDEGTAVADLFDFIQAYKCSLEEEKNVADMPAAEGRISTQRSKDVSPPLSATFCDFEEEKRSTIQIGGLDKEASCSRITSVDDSMPTLSKLEEMGFCQAQIQKASDECSSIDFDVLLSYLLLDSNTDGKVNPFITEDLEAIAILKHKDEDFAFYARKKAWSSSESNDTEELWDVDSYESLKEKGKAAVVEDTQPITHAESSLSSLLSSGAERSFRYGAERSFRYDFDKQEESSKIKYVPKGVVVQESGAAIRWTKAMENLWSSYMGGAKKFECLPLADLDESAEIFQSTWEEKSQNSSFCKRKSHVVDSKPIEKATPQPGKMMGFGIPGLFIGRPKQLPQTMTGRPYFYFENVAGVPNKEWETIKRHFNGVDPEFTDSKFFSASRRPRGYVHNLPVEGRTSAHYKPLMTIFEAFPHMQKYWPQWDKRDKLNCINTRKAADKMCGLIRTLFAIFEGKELPYQRQQEIVQVCKKWNLVWVGPGKAAPLEPHEIEILLGFDQDHTRGCASMTERYDALGNSFQVDTVAYHLSPLKALYPNGIIVLTLFSGIGGAEVALHKVGFYLKVVIAVEINEKVRGILATWWRRSGQKGELRLKNDVREMTYDELANLIDEVGPIDLIIGGSPCNNLSGNNRVSRNGLNGSESSLFFEFPRILNIVKQVMHDKGFL